VEHGFPIAVSETLAHAEQLVPAMVELEHERVGVIAVEAWMLAGDSARKSARSLRVLACVQSVAE
jgi:hypothetical protein